MPPSTTPTLCAVPERDPGDRALGGAGEERLARLQATGVEQLVPGGQHRGARADGRRLGGGDGRRGDAGAVPAAQLVELGVHRGERLQAEVDAERVGEPVEHAVVGQRVRRRAPAGTGAGAPPT